MSSVSTLGWLAVRDDAPEPSGRMRYVSCPPLRVMSKLRFCRLGACPRNSGLWWRRLLESDSVCL